MNYRSLVTALLMSLMLCSCLAVKKENKNSAFSIWYDEPANSSTADVKNGWQNDPEWLKALPIGNGFLGAMVFGDVNKERIQLNEKTLWSGSPNDNNNSEAVKALGKIRQLLFAGKYKEADILTEETQVCKGLGSGHGNGADEPYGCYQTLGDLWFDFNKTSSYQNYHKELDLTQGLVKISFEQDGVVYRREVFASYPDRAIVIHLSASKRSALSFTTKLSRPERFTTKLEKDHLLMQGRLKDGKGGEGMSYAARLKSIATGGEQVYTDSTISVKNANEVTLILVASTDYKQEYPTFKGEDPVSTTEAALTNVSSKPYETILKRHIEDYSSLFRRVSLKLADRGADTIPTDIRLQNPDDLHLQEIYFQFGRYLLISSSRRGSLPANLQGIWANKIQTPWNSDYHANINLQMNYWPAEFTNLGECAEPLTELIASLVKPGEETARVQYNAGGWCSQTITNVWGYTSPGEGTSWGMYVVGSGWLCHHLWDHYLYTQDLQYLKRVYPVMLQAAQFYLDWLVPDPKTGKLVSGPSVSPENRFITSDGTIGSVTMGPSHDQEIIYDLFTNVEEASKILEENNSILEKIVLAKGQLAKPKIGSDGRLMEWQKEFREEEPHHRHVSHLYMLYPGDQVDLQKTPELAAAARKTLEARGDKGTGWSLAWKVNFWARLKDGERAYKLLQALLQPTQNYSLNMSDAGGTYTNLFCGHPPFQIDGNFGATAGMAEMLLQSQSGCIDLLPALPLAWKNGEVKGLVARGGFVVEMKWQDSALTQVVINSTAGQNCVIRSSYQLQVDGTSIRSGNDGNIFVITFDTEAGKTYQLSACR